MLGPDGEGIDIHAAAFLWTRNISVQVRLIYEIDSLLVRNYLAALESCRTGTR